MTEIIAENIGIDISKNKLDVARFPCGATSQFANNAQGHKALGKWLSQFKVARITFEPTGVYHRELERFLSDRGLPCSVVNPCQARRFSQAAGKLAKTDKVDAIMLARFGAMMAPPKHLSKSHVVEKLQELVSARRSLMKDRTSIINRLKTLVSPLLKRLTGQQLKQIEGHIKTINEACYELIEAHETLRDRLAILESIPGISMITGTALLSEMPELGTMDKRQVAALAGLAPITRQSGSWKGRSFIRGGRSRLRRALYMPALVAIRKNEDLKSNYEKLIADGKPFKVAITAIMRKMIVTANALLRDNRKWSAHNA